MNNVRFEPDASLTDVLEGPAARNTMLTVWFDANSKHVDCRHLTYCDFPKEWSWDASQRRWRKKHLALKLVECTMCIHLMANSTNYACC
jgi:hypothetical protein